MGLTSSDIVDTSLAVQMTEALDLILDDLEELISVLKRQALKYKHMVMVGRSHGIHGEPISFGFKLAIWYEEACRHRERLTHVRQEIAVGNSPARWAPSRIKGLKWKPMCAPSWGSRRTLSPIKSCSAIAMHPMPRHWHY